MNLIKELLKKPLQLTPWLISILFFIISLITLPGYGINWDTINHLPRGQAYLNYFLTGNDDFSNLHPFVSYFQNPKELAITIEDKRNLRSLYQTDAMTFEWFMENDGGGHPPLSDILSSVFNVILFQNLKLINDIDAYRVYTIFLSTCLVFITYHFVYRKYGQIAAVFACLFLITYPLFWSELHFNNEKDIPETVFISLMFFWLWKSFLDRNWRLNILTGIFFGLALGTKFNVLFCVFPVSFFLFFMFLKEKNKKGLFKNKDVIRLYGSVLLIPLIGFFIFYISWPYLWQDPLSRIEGVIHFYKTIGLTTNIDSRFVGPLNMNTYPIIWILYTTPVVTLAFFVIGFIFSLKSIFKDNSGLSILILVWFLTPILKASFPGVTTYGGVRQIMEYIPAMAIISGIGVYYFSNLLTKVVLKNRIHLAWVFLMIIVVGFVPHILQLVAIHPNENVYFNSLLGGLDDAKQKNIPFWGNSFGAAYRTGIIWINDHAEPNSKIVLARELIPNVPKIWLRADLELHNSFRSGYLKQGEYVMTLSYQGTENTSYFDRYLDTILIPVYETQIDGVSILKIWKNDINHTKSDYQKDLPYTDYGIEYNDQKVVIDMNKKVSLSRIEVFFDNEECEILNSAEVSISNDNKNWLKLPGRMPKEDWSVPRIGDQPTNNSFILPFAADKARFVKIDYSPTNACLGKIIKSSVFVFTDEN